jgi:hypothetical protein
VIGSLNPHSPWGRWNRRRFRQPPWDTARFRTAPTSTRSRATTAPPNGELGSTHPPHYPASTDGGRCSIEPDADSLRATPRSKWSASPSSGATPGAGSCAGLARTRSG